MAKAKDLQKTTVLLPRELLDRATKATGEGITPTIRRGLELLAARDAYRELRNFRGKYRSKLNVSALREDK